MLPWAHFSSDFFLEGRVLTASVGARSCSWMFIVHQFWQQFIFWSGPFDEPQWGPLRLLGPAPVVGCCWGFGSSFVLEEARLNSFRSDRSGRWMFWGPSLAQFLFVLTASEGASSGCWMLSWDRAALEAVCFEGTVFTALAVALPGS